LDALASGGCGIVARGRGTASIVRRTASVVRRQSFCHCRLKFGLIIFFSGAGGRVQPDVAKSAIVMLNSHHGLSQTPSSKGK